MKGFVFSGNRSTTRLEKPTPTPGPGEILVQSRISSICGTDLHMYKESVQARMPYNGVFGGHETVGDVVSIGEGVRWPLVGDRVVGHPVVGCNACGYCRIGDFRSCKSSLNIGNIYGYGVDGSNAEFVLLSAGQALPLPEDFTYEAGAVLSCNFGTAWSAVRKAVGSACGPLAIWGLGPVGLSVVLVARSMGIRTIGVDLSEARREVAQRLGADVIDGAAPNLQDLIADLTSGYGPQAAIDTTGIGAVHTTMVSSVRRGGTIVLIAGGPSAPLDSTTSLHEISIMGTWVYGVEDWPEILEFVRTHAIDLESVVGAVYPIDLFDEAIKEAATASAAKIILRW